MKLYWGLNSIPELQGLPKSQQHQLWRASQRVSLRSWRCWVAYSLVGLMGALTYIVMKQIPWMALPDEPLTPVVVGAFIGGLYVFSAQQVVIPFMRPILASRRAAMESQSPADGSYHVPPAF